MHGERLECVISMDVKVRFGLRLLAYERGRGWMSIPQLTVNEAQAEAPHPQKWLA